MQLKFDNYLLRPLEKKDATAFFELIDTNRKRLEDFFAGTVSKNRTLEETQSFIPDVLDRTSKQMYFAFVIVDLITDTLIGYADIKTIDWNIPKAELGYFVDEKYEGKGIISKVMARIIAHCFNDLELKKISLRVHESNIPSIKIAEKNGFRKEGMIRSDYKMTNGVIIDVLYYGLLKEEYNG